MAMMYQDRAALIASSQIPLIVALAGKNNVISCTSFIGILETLLMAIKGLTGVSHEKVRCPFKYA